MNKAINLNAHIDDKKFCIVNIGTMHLLFTTSSKDIAIDMLRAELPTGGNYASRGYIVQNFNVVSQVIKDYNTIQ